ncbi:unnamed protein product [Symbiodinium natans]|uniref:Uncharacterized protein n=1 Tax=Symbiodinium natans TaxID=878477 RepID=A0A812P7V9_9DINO|nr:unnamed protein product [Symbiodinium natans]
MALVGIARHVSRCSQHIQLFKAPVRALPRLAYLLREGLAADLRVKLRLPPPLANAGKALQWAKSVVRGVLDTGPTVHKIGLSGNPLFRFYKKPSVASPSPGYYHSADRFQGMYVLFAGSTWDEASLMEAVLISEFRDTAGNRNVNPGGEGRQVYDPPYFTYFVFKSLMRPATRR